MPTNDDCRGSINDPDYYAPDFDEAEAERQLLNPTEDAERRQYTGVDYAKQQRLAQKK